MRHVLLAASAVALSACATTTGVNWTDSTVTQIETGMSKASVLSLFGNPTSQSITDKGEVLIFKRASDESGAVGKYITVMTLGVRSGENAIAVDALRVELKNDVVTGYEYTENVDNNFGQAGLK